MELEKSKISSSHLIFLIVGFTTGTSVILPIGIEAKHNAWLAILAALGVGLILAFIYSNLAMRFSGKNLIQINDLIYGPYLGRVISLGYLWFFFQSASIILRELGDFSLIILPETPMLVFIIFTALICASVVRNGIEVITRCSGVLVPVMGIVVLVTTVLLLKDMEFKNFLPIFDVSLEEFTKASLGVVSLPFGQLIVFLMVIPFLNNIKQARVSIITGLIFSGTLLLIISIETIAVLGGTVSIHTYPFYQVGRLIDIAKILTRLEILIALSFLAMIFLKTSVFYYATVLGLAQLLKLRSYLPLVLPIGILMVAFSILLFENTLEVLAFLVEIWPYYSFPFQIGIPVLSLIIAMIKGVKN